MLLLFILLEDGMLCCFVTFLLSTAIHPASSRPPYWDTMRIQAPKIEVSYSCCESYFSFQLCTAAISIGTIVADLHKRVYVCVRVHIEEQNLKYCIYYWLDGEK